MNRCLIALLPILLTPSLASAQRTHVLIVSGISGEPRFATQWNAWGRQLAEGLQASGVAATDIVRLGEQPGPGVQGRSTKEGIGAQVLRIAGGADASDQVLLVFFGHGSGDGDGVRLNLPGPDLTGRELDVMLQAFPTQRVIVVNAASASGGFLEPLAGRNRVVVTATRSEAQNNETVFGEHFAAAFTGGSADTDKDRRVSLLEAFTYARLEVERAYSSTNRMRAEHALIDADGDGSGTAEPDARAGDGRVASTIFFGAGTPSAVAAEGAPANAGPELRALYQRRMELQASIDALRGRRDSMAAARYEADLERLLVELATTNQSIRRLEGGER